MPSSKKTSRNPLDLDDIRLRAAEAQAHAVKATNYAARVRAMSIEVCNDANKLLRRLKEIDDAGKPPPDAAK